MSDGTCTRTMSLHELGLADEALSSLHISGLAASSRDVRPGYLFAALPGTNLHGANFICEALRRGAAMTLTDADGAQLISSLAEGCDIPVLITEAPRSGLARAAARWFAMTPDVIAAVTGTNGKTSVASMCRQIWQAIGHRASNCGTSGIEGDFEAATGLTTPEPIVLHQQLAQMHEAGITHAVLEASSHGLDQRRIDGLAIKAAAFTNLSHDHLDYHDSWDDYFAAKASLFERCLDSSGVAVICMGDEYGTRMRGIAEHRGVDVITIGGGDESLAIVALRCNADGIDLRYAWRGSTRQARLNLIGPFQARNALTAAGLAIGCGDDPDIVLDALEQVKAAPGRMQLAARRSNGAPVFVDYAHTPHALISALNAMRAHMMGRLTVIVGAGGNRDQSKREPMGQAAARYADRVYVTDDNPRHEDASAIRRAIIKGCPDAVEIADRAEAILMAVDALRPGDALLVAGKGHEATQIIGNDEYPFSDVEQASIAVRALDGLGT